MDRARPSDEFPHWSEEPPEEFPHWSEKPPDGYPFNKHLIGCYLTQRVMQSRQATPNDLEEIRKCGIQKLKDKEYCNALWKFENCLLISDMFGDPPNIVKFASNCALAILKLYETTDESSKQEQLLGMCVMFCDRCLQIGDPCTLAKPYYRLGEAFRLSNNSIGALEHFKRSYEIEKNLRTLSKVILLNGPFDEQFDFETKFISLLKLLLKSQLSLENLKCFIANESVSKAVLVSAKSNKIPNEICLQLLKLSCESKQLLSKMLSLLSYDDVQVVGLLADTDTDDHFCLQLLQVKQMKSSQLIIAKLSESSRTEYCLDMLNKGKIKRAVLAMKVGIDPTQIDLSTLPKLLNNTELLQSLLDCRVDPCGLTGPPALKRPLESLVISFQTQTKHKEACPKAVLVKSMKLLVNAGADVEDLNKYYNGGKTTPLHVATSMALITGDVDFLRSVHGKWEGCSPPLDKDDKTPLHIAAECFQNPRTGSRYLADVWKCLIDECEIDQSVKDNKGKTAMLYLPADVKKSLKMTTDQEKDQQREQPTELPVKMPLQDNAADLPVNVAPTQSQSCQSSEFDTSKDVKTSTEELRTTSEELAVKLAQNSSPQQVEKMMEEVLRKPDSYFLADKSPPVERATQDTQNITSTAYSQPAETATPIETTQSKQQTGKRSKKSAKASKTKKAATLTQTVNQIEAEDGIWEVEIPDHVYKRLKKIQSHRSKEIRDTIQKLASGHWNVDLKKEIKKDSSCAVYEARINDADRLLYAFLRRFSERRTDAIKDLTDKSVHLYTNKIYVLDIVLNHTRIDKHAERALKIVKRATEHRSYKPVNEGYKSQRKIPQLFVHSDPQLTTEELEKIRLHLNSKVERSEQKKEEDTGEKTYSFTAQLALGILNGEHDRRDYPIKITDDEFDIITKPERAPVVVLGRSGTGKTTTCLCRMWKKFTDYWDNSERLQNPFIPKVTRSKTETTDTTEECTSKNQKVEPCDNKHQSKDLPIQSDVVHQETFEEQGLPPEVPPTEQFDETAEDCEHLHQVFITKSSKLCTQMKKRFYDFVAAYEPAKGHQEYETKEVPKSFSELDDLSFPLFITARKYFLMLDKSLDDKQDYFHEKDKIISTEQSSTNTRHQLLEIFGSDSDEEQDKKEKCRERVEVTESYFQAHIWKHLVKFCSDDKTDPLLVWMEIQSFIKGSREALCSEGGVLSEDDYKAFGEKRAHNFPLQREEVYKLFREYTNHLQHKSIDKSVFDNGDFIYKLYKRMEAKSEMHTWSIHRIYVDEVQDFTQAELSVLAQCCVDPNGFFLTGDTAQTIIKGIAFRFEDLKSIFYSLKKQKANVRVPKVHMLTINHRSHRGITDIATSVTDLLMEFFPQSFDWHDVPKDTSNIKGPKPLFIGSKKLMENFLMFRGSKSESHLSSVEFGANQTVIVRDKHAMEKLPGFLKQGIVLSIQQCKGLEFRDVLLYNFFTDFPGQSDIWRASATYMERKPEMVKHHSSATTRPLTFDQAHHKSLCAELKYLYTVVTRAKQHLWIYEDSSANELPMLDYWQGRGVVKAVTSFTKEDMDEHFPEDSSTKSDWKKQGDTMGSEGLWEVAMKCYQKAGEQLLERQAFIKTLNMKDEREKETIHKQRMATVANLECDELEHNVDSLISAATCLFQARMYQLSAKLFEKLHMYKEASRIYHKQLRDVENCARMKEKLGDYYGAVHYCFTRKKPKLGLDLAKRYKREGHLEQEPKLSEIAYSQIRKYLKTRNISDLEEWVTFIPDSNLQISLLKQAGMYREAYKILCKKQMFREAFRLLSAQSMFVEGIQLARETKEQCMKNSFILQQATAEIVKFKRVKTDELQTQLSQLSKEASKECDLQVTTKAKLLYALGVSQHKDAATAAAECKHAQDLYRNKLKNRVGEIECFHLMRTLQLDKDKLLHSSVRNTVHYTREIEKVCGYIEQSTATATSSSAIRHLEGFYGLQKTGNVYYCIPKEQDVWIRELKMCVNEDEQVDSDGMLKLDRGKVLNAVVEHLKKYAIRWEKDMGKMSTTLERKFELAYRFHVDLKKDGYLQPRSRKFGNEQIRDYIENCELSRVVHQLHPESFQYGDPIGPLLKLLSPFSQLFLHFTKESYELITESKTLNPALKKQAEVVLNKSSHYPPTCDEWMKVWQIYSILGKSMDDIGRVISKQKQTVNERSKKREYKPPYDYKWSAKNQSYEHYFSFWLGSCKLLRDGNKALVAIDLSMHHFVEVIARRRSLSISTENLINILSVHTTALLAMLSQSFQLQKRYQNKVFLPETFEKLVDTFDILNCHGLKNCSLLATCLQTANSMNGRIDKLQQTIFTLLHQILDLLLGRYNQDFCTLRHSVTSVVQIKSGDALNCLLLTFTVFGNLALCDPSGRQHLKEIYTDICSDLKHTPEEGEKLKIVHSSFQHCTTTKGIFQDVISKLITPLEMGIVEIRPANPDSESKAQLKFKHCTLNLIPSLSLPYTTPSIPTTHQNVPSQCPQPNEHTTNEITPAGDDQSQSELCSDNNLQHMSANPDIQSYEEAPVSEAQPSTTNIEEDQTHHQELQRMLSHSDDEVGDDDRDIEDEDIIEEIRLIAETTYEEVEDHENETEDTLKDLVDDETCKICNSRFENKADSIKHQQTEGHNTKAKQHDEYQQTLETEEYESHARILYNSLTECKQMGLENVSISAAFLEAEQEGRNCTSAIDEIEQNCDWQGGREKIHALVGKLISTTVRLKVQMNLLRNKQITASQTIGLSVDGEDGDLEDSDEDIPT